MTQTMRPLSPKMAKTDEPSVLYDTTDHIGVIFSLYASIWPKVLPYCIINTAIAFAVNYFDAKSYANLSFSDKGHHFMSAMVSYLLVTRSHIAVKRYMESRDLLSQIMKSCRELVQHTVTFTRYDHSKKAKKWRADIARRTCSMLRAIVSVLRYDIQNEHVWQVAELSKVEKQALLSAVGGCNERSPLVLLIFLRTSIASHVEFLQKPLDVNQELKLLSNSAEFNSAYHGLMKMITTPFSFPLVQMCRTFVMVWVFSLPLALSNDVHGYFWLLSCVFFITYGFIGLEFVSIEMDNPFGDGPNDFDVFSLARVVFEDIFITIHDVDGKENSEMLRESVERPLKDQLKSEVKKHKKYSRMSSWGGSIASSTKSPNSFEKSLAFSSPPKTVMAHRKTPSQRSVLLECAWSNENVGEIFGKDENSLLKNPLGNYGTVTSDSNQKRMETGQKPTSLMTYQNRSRPLLTTKESIDSYSETSAQSSRGTSSIDGEDTNLLRGDKLLPENFPNEAVFSPLSSISHNEPPLGDEPYGSRDFDSSFDDSLRSFDGEFTSQNIRSSIFAGLRNRLDTDASIEVFGVDEKVKLDPESNSLLVKSKNPEEVLDP